MNGKKIVLIGGAGFIGHNLAVDLKKQGHEIMIIDNLAVNNVLSFTDAEIKNRKLYWSILNQRVDLLHEKNIEINVEDGCNYNALSMLVTLALLLLFNLQLFLMQTSQTKTLSTFDHTLRTLENTLTYLKTWDVI